MNETTTTGNRKTDVVHVQETQETWGVVTVRVGGAEEAGRLAEAVFDPAENRHHGTSRTEASVLTEASSRPVTTPTPPAGQEATGFEAEVPPSVAAALRAVLGLYLEDEGRDFLGQGLAGRRTHVFPHLVVLARHAAPEFLDILADPEVLHALNHTNE